MTKHLLRQESYQIIIVDNVPVQPEPDSEQPGPSNQVYRDDDLSGIRLPMTHRFVDGVLHRDDEDETFRIAQKFVNGELSDSSDDSDSEYDEYDDDDDYTPPPSPKDEPVDDPMDQDEAEELIDIIDHIIEVDPSILNNPRPVLDLNVCTYGTSHNEPETEELVLHYYVHPSDPYITG